MQHLKKIIHIDTLKACNSDHLTQAKQNIHQFKPIQILKLINLNFTSIK